MTSLQDLETLKLYPPYRAHMAIIAQGSRRNTWHTMAEEVGRWHRLCRSSIEYISTLDSREHAVTSDRARSPNDQQRVRVACSLQLAACWSGHRQRDFSSTLLGDSSRMLHNTDVFDSPVVLLDRHENQDR